MKFLELYILLYYFDGLSYKINVLKNGCLIGTTKLPVHGLTKFSFLFIDAIMLNVFVLTRTDRTQHDPTH